MLGCFFPSSSSNPYSALNLHGPIVGILKIKHSCAVTAVSSCALRYKFNKSVFRVVLSTSRGLELLWFLKMWSQQ